MDERRTLTVLVIMKNKFYFALWIVMLKCGDRTDAQITSVRLTLEVDAEKKNVDNATIATKKKYVEFLR